MVPSARNPRAFAVPRAPPRERKMKAALPHFELHGGRGLRHCKLQPGMTEAGAHAGYEERRLRIVHLAVAPRANASEKRG